MSKDAPRPRSIMIALRPVVLALLVITWSAQTILVPCVLAISAALMDQHAHQQGTTMSTVANTRRRMIAQYLFAKLVPTSLGSQFNTALLMMTSCAQMDLAGCVLVISAAQMDQRAHQRACTTLMVVLKPRFITIALHQVVLALLVITWSAQTILVSCVLAISAALMDQHAHRQPITMFTVVNTRRRMIAPSDDNRHCQRDAAFLEGNEVTQPVRSISELH